MRQTRRPEIVVLSLHIIGIIAATLFILCIKDRISYSAVSELFYVVGLMLVPGLSVITGYVLSRQYPNRERVLWRTGFWISCIASLFCVIVVPIFFVFSYTSDHNIGEYTDIMQRNDSDTRTTLAHFPKKLPREARHAEFYWEGFRGVEYALQFDAPESYLKAEEAKYHPHATQVQNGTKCYGDVDKFLPPSCYGSGDLPTDFKVIVIHADKGDTGYANGISVSLERGHIIYWAEAW